jgi:hypothetical protein
MRKGRKGNPGQPLRQSTNRATHLNARKQLREFEKRQTASIKNSRGSTMAQSVAKKKKKSNDATMTFGLYVFFYHIFSGIWESITGLFKEDS